MNKSIIYLPVESLNTRKRFLLLDVGRVWPEDRWKRRAKEDRQHREVPRLVHEVLDAKAFVVNFDSFSVAGDQLPVGGESDDVIELSEAHDAADADPAVDHRSAEAVDGFQIFDRIDRLHENLLPVNIELDDLRLHGQVKFFASLANEVHDRVVAATFRPTKVAPGAPQLRIQQVQLHRDVHGWLSVRLDSSIQL